MCTAAAKVTNIDCSIVSKYLCSGPSKGDDNKDASEEWIVARQLCRFDAWECSCLMLSTEGWGKYSLKFESNSPNIVGYQQITSII